MATRTPRLRRTQLFAFAGIEYNGFIGQIVGEIIAVFHVLLFRPQKSAVVGGKTCTYVEKQPISCVLTVEIFRCNLR